jgi:hypothetical protein
MLLIMLAGCGPSEGGNAVSSTRSTLPPAPKIDEPIVVFGAVTTFKVSPLEISHTDVVAVELQIENVTPKAVKFHYCSADFVHVHIQLFDADGKRVRWRRVPMREVSYDEVEIQPKSSVKVSKCFRIRDYYEALTAGKVCPIPAGIYHMKFRYDMRLMEPNSIYPPEERPPGAQKDRKPVTELKDEMPRMVRRPGDDPFIPWSNQVIELRLKDD